MTAVRWGIVIIAVLASGPAGSWLRRQPALRLRLWTLLGLLPFLPPFRMALLVFPIPSDTHGFETMPLIDGLALCLLRSARPRERPLPYRFALVAYLLVVATSMLQGRWPMLTAGYLWTLTRMIVVLVAIWRAGGEDLRVVPAVLRGLTLGIVYEAGLTAWQHFGQGLSRASGSFSGWNDVGLALNLVVMVPVARILAGRTSLLTRLTPLAAVVGGICAVSRGALLFFGLGITIVWVGSIVREYTGRKAAFGLAGLLLAAVIVPIALTVVRARGSAADRQESMAERDRLEDAAALMLSEHPMGVGASHFMPELFLGGYGPRAGLGWHEWTAIVHNIYWLTAAEMGYVGVLALLALFLIPLRLAFFRRPRGPRGDVLLGLGAGLLVFSLHLFFEWAWRLSQISYLYFISIGLVAAVAQPARPRRRPRRPDVGTRRATGAPAAPPAVSPAGPAPRRTPEPAALRLRVSRSSL